MQLSSLGACLESSAYMCFYVKRRLEYKPHTRPTYVIARETEAMKEKQLEKAKEKEKEKEKNREIEDALLAVI